MRKMIQRAIRRPRLILPIVNAPLFVTIIMVTSDHWR
jgi:hypothetical protein